MVALVAVFGLIGGLGSNYSTTFDVPDSDTKDGFDILEAHYGGFGTGWEGSVVFKAPAGVNAPEVAGPMQALLADIDAIDGVSIESPYTPMGASRISPGGEIAYAAVSIPLDYGQEDVIVMSETMHDLIEEHQLADRGIQVELGGEALAGFEPPESEAIGLAFAVFILIAATGSVIAMGTTIGVALLGVATGVGLGMLISHVMMIPEFATTIALMIGIGVGIDYALFIITRYREGTRAGLDPAEATAVAMDTAGRSVSFAGITVVVSLLGLLLIGLDFVSGLGISSALVVIAVMVACLTLLPALIGLMQHRIETTLVRGVAGSAMVAVALLALGLGLGPGVALIGLVGLVLVAVFGFLIRTDRNPLRRKLPPRIERPLRETIWYRLSRRVQARPWLFAVGGTLLLVLLALPVLSLRMGFSDEGNFPAETTTRKAYDLLAEGFGPGANGPIMVVAETSGDADMATLAELSASLNSTPGVVFASPPIPAPNGQAAMIQVQATTSPQQAETRELVERLRDQVVPSAVEGTGLDPAVTGRVPSFVDFSDYLAARIPVFFGAVLGLSFLLLMAVFRSILVPLKAVIMNMLSIGAAYGIVVAIFQWGWGGSVIGVAEGPIEPFIPMMLFAVLFGLSMDYEVFLLSRIKEEFVHTGDAVNSVADGLAATARVISAAAAIMVVVFSSFVFEDLRVIKLFGIGLASAIMIDATLVRMLIVPSTMELLGERNWWFPAWLDRIVPQLNIEGNPTED